MIFFASLFYAIVGAAMAGIWSQRIASYPLPFWKRLVGIMLYCWLWPVMIAGDVWEALKIERKFRAARKRGEL